MKTRWTILLAIVSIGIGLAYWQVDVVSPAVAGDEVVPAAAPGTDVPDKYEYVGNKKCKKCHMKEYKSWQTTKKAMTFEPLKPGNASEAKLKAKLDPAKDYTKDESCLACHATGHGQPGGYFIPDPADEAAVKKAKKLEGVGCEGCHGPGSEYIKLHEEINKSKRTYKDEEMYKAGLRKIEASACTGCHNEKSPTYVPFDFEKQKHEGLHELYPLKQREE
ncbi:MAG: cytochrome c family protein [Phycisphaerae bacterium]